VEEMNVTGKHDEWDQEEDCEDGLDEEKEAQKDAMREWFYERFEDPANSTPYESAEGGYLYIWGGPYEASDVLFNEFSGEYPDEVIDELAEELTDECCEWAPVVTSDLFDEETYERIRSFTDAFNAFQGGVLDVKKLASSSIANDMQPLFYNMLYVQSITVLETYLCDAFIHSVSKDDMHIKSFIKKSGLYRDSKVILADIFDECDKLINRAKAEIARTTWHNLERVRKYYNVTLDVQIEEDLLRPIKAAVEKRHHIVHRNGKDIERKPISVTQEEVLTLLQSIETVVLHIEGQLNPA